MDDIILLSDDDEVDQARKSIDRSATVPLPHKTTVPRPSSPIVLGLSPPRKRKSASPEVISLSKSPSPIDSRPITVESPPRKQPRSDFASAFTSDDYIEKMLADPMFGGKGAVRPSTSTSLPPEGGEKGEKKKRQKKDEEGAEEKRRKQAERAQQKKEREEKKAGEAKEKKLKAIEREISASKKSRAEEYLYLRVGRGVLEMIDGLEAALRVLMTDRKIDMQLEISSSLGCHVEWWRKSIEAMELEEGRGVERVESMIREPLEVIVLEADELAKLIKEKKIEQYVRDQRASLQVSNALLLLMIHGKLNVKDSERDSQAVVLHEKLRTQIRETHTPNEAALFLCQLHRAAAKHHTKRSEKIIADVVKGQRERDGLVADWWGKMLGMVPKIAGIYARCIAAAYPNPIKLMQRIEKEGKDVVENEMAEIRSDIGHRVGNKRARKIVDLLSTEDGMELFT